MGLGATLRSAELAGRSKPNRQVWRQYLEDFINRLFEDDPHADRVKSLTNGVNGVLHLASSGIRTIGQRLTKAQGPTPRNAIKQVGWLPSNRALSKEINFESWVPFCRG